AQDSENITVENICFAPGKGSARKMASVADFIQLCMCRGKVTVKDSYFDGAGDDLLNVHGIHFKITEIKGKDLTVRFMHPQSHGFNPLRVGDAIAYINPETLLEEGTAVIEDSKLINEYEILIKVSDLSGAKQGFVIEDITACPELEFTGNSSTRIITRGLLITTRGKVNVENNHFTSTSMSGILLSDDAKSWYESGMCRDVTIKNNTFDYCGGTPILIKPENRKYAGAVHENIRIIGNTFKKYNGACISIKDSNDILIENNTYKSSKKIKTKNCKNVSGE
ncbi:MAG: right-handed parallel beta-helix repeat-containing protein, partial [Acutalibacteraceae bacterium]